VFSKFVRGLRLRNIEHESRESRGFFPRVAMMKPSDAGQSDYFRGRRGAIFNIAMLRCIPKASMDLIVVVVIDVFSE